MINYLKLKFNNLLKESSYNFSLSYCFGQPSIFAVETTNRCNLKCIMCPRTTIMKRRIGDIDFNLFKKIVDEASKYTKFMWLHDFGEPLLHPRIIDMIKYAKEKGIKTGISVNGGVLTEKLSRELIDSQLDHIIFSFDGFSKKTYQKYRVGGNFENIKKNILKFLKIKKELKSKLPYIQIKMINMKDTTKEIENFKKEWTNKADEVLITNFVDWAGQISNEENVSGATIESQKYPCKAFWTSIVVLWDGKVVPCCKDCDGRLVLGDLNKQSIREIWNNKSFKKIREDQIKHKFKSPLCYNCHEAVGKPTKKFIFELIKNKYGKT
jgi:radical SAM protein with 4Fe4S-binding SPASM domain